LKSASARASGPSWPNMSSRSNMAVHSSTLRLRPILTRLQRACRAAYVH